MSSKNLLPSPRNSSSRTGSKSGVASISRKSSHERFGRSGRKINSSPTLRISTRFVPSANLYSFGMRTDWLRPFSKTDVLRAVFILALRQYRLSYTAALYRASAKITSRDVCDCGQPVYGVKLLLGAGRFCFLGGGGRRVGYVRGGIAPPVRDGKRGCAPRLLAARSGKGRGKRLCRRE